MIAAGTKTPFIVYALPRSRTAWLSAFLSYGDWACTHDQAMTLRSIQDARDFFGREETGTVETGVAPGWRLVNVLCPGIREVVIRRPVAEVMESFRAIDVSAVAVYDWDRLQRSLVYQDRCLQQIAARPGVLVMNSSDLAAAAAGARLFEHCLPYRFDHAWWEDMSRRNIQIDVVEQLRYAFAHRPEIEAFKRECRREMRTLARSAQGRTALERAA